MDTATDEPEGRPKLKTKKRRYTLTGDANVEPDLAGYKIHCGAQKRGEALGAIHAWCAAHEPTYDKCEAEWEAICTDDTRAHHQMLFGHDRSVDVGNVTQYTLTGLDEETKYYLAATVYDDEDNESV